MKNYILDTTILLYDPRVLFSFKDNHLHIPITVVEELDRFKSDFTETGRNARHTTRILDRLRKRGSLSEGVKLGNGGYVSVRISSAGALAALPSSLTTKNRDASLLSLGLELKKKSNDPTILLTKDINLRIKADSIGIAVQDYESDKVDIDHLYPGHIDLYVESEIVKNCKNLNPYACEKKFLPNQYISLIDNNDPTNFAYGRYCMQSLSIVPLYQYKNHIHSRIAAKNKEQAFALDALLNDHINFVTLVGKAGTGKTLLAVAASIYKTVDESVYNRILVSRPTLPMGKDIGYLPGNVEEKLTPWMYPIADNIELLMSSNAGTNDNIRGFKELTEMGILIIEPLTFIRGRSIHNQFLIVDEAQNLTPHEIKTIITRVGDGTKIVLTGDPYQIDNPYIDSSSNGLSYVVERFKNESITAHVLLSKGERSPISELAANLL